MRKEIKTDLDNILDIVICSTDYGFGKTMFFDFCSSLINKELSDQEIESFSKRLSSQDGYTQEDYESAKERLHDFKSKYCNLIQKCS
jgi:hypothetical protein